MQAVIDELGGEKIDIIEYSEDPVKFIANSLSPAKILNVQLDEDTKEAKVGVLEDQRIPFDVEREDAKHCVLRGEGMERKTDNDRNVIHHRNLYAPRVSIGDEHF